MATAMPFDMVEEGERHFAVMVEPTFEHGLSAEMLAKVDTITAERWKLEALMGKHIEWLVKDHVEMNNKMFHMETEVIRGRKFRNWLWTRMTLTVSALAIAYQVVGPKLKEWIFGP